MIEEEAEVVHISANTMRVRVDRKTACGHCSIADSCGNGVLEKLFMRRNSVIEFDLPVTDELKMGDRLMVGVADNALIKSAAIGYSIPLMGLFVGLLLGTGLSRLWQIESEWLEAVGLLLGLAVGFFGMMRVARRLREHPAFSPVFIRRIVNESSVPSCRN